MSDSQPTSLSSYYTNLEEEEEDEEEEEEEEEEDDIKQVCIERWLCGIPGDSSSADGNCNICYTNRDANVNNN